MAGTKTVIQAELSKARRGLLWEVGHAWPQRYSSKEPMTRGQRSGRGNHEWGQSGEDLRFPKVVHSMGQNH